MKKLVLLTVLLLALVTQKSNAQVTVSNNNTVSGDYVGSQLGASLTDVIFENNGTNTMTLKTSGDLNIVGGANGYQIGGQYVLWLTPTLAYNNTWVGLSGNASGASIQCTYVGYESGFSSTIFSNNCSFLGDFSGYSNQGSGNTFMGWECGYGNTNGDFNTFYGIESGYTNNLGAGNAFFGGSSGYDNTTGSNNTFIGANAGQTNTTGGQITILGAGADVATNNLNDACAIGSGAVVKNNSNMILGDNTVNVGIGMSNITGGPTNKLEISQYSLGSPDPTHTVTPTSFSLIVGSGTATGASGLQFRDLTTASYQYPYVTNQGFLTLDDYGNVVYMTPPPAVISGTGSFGVCPAPGMTANEGLDLSGFNLYFVGNNGGLNTNDVYLGYGCGTLLPRDVKLAVEEQSTSDNSIGINVVNTDPNAGILLTPQPLIGIRSLIPTPSVKTYYNVAGWFQAAPYYPNATVAPQKQYAIFVPAVLGVNGIPVIQGTVDIGYRFALDKPDFLLDVNGYGRTLAGVIPSDSILKKNVTAFKYGIKAIRNLNPVSYQYNGVGGFDSTSTFIGVIAQNLKRNVPKAVVSSLITKDTITYDTTTILNVYDQAVMYTAVNAIKEVDSAATSNLGKQAQTNDSLRNGLYASGWSLTGNAGTSPGTNFVGTTDAEALEFQVDGKKSGWLDYTSPGNTAFGYESENSTTGQWNTATGYQAMYTNTSGNYNTAYGFQALYTNSTGSYNVAVGRQALNYSTGSDNTAVGNLALQANTSGTDNTAIGYQILYSNTSGTYNTGIGDNTLYTNSTGNYNTGVGYNALYYNTGSNNTAVGKNSLLNTTGADNVAVGEAAGGTNTTGTNNTFIGYGADFAGGATNYTNSTALGNGTTITASNQVNIGNTSVSTIQGEVNYSTYSDRRIKTNIQQNVPGLVFINKLQPVTYNLNR